MVSGICLFLVSPTGMCGAGASTTSSLVLKPGSTARCGRAQGIGLRSVQRSRKPFPDEEAARGQGRPLPA